MAIVDARPLSRMHQFLETYATRQLESRRRTARQTGVLTVRVEQTSGDETTICSNQNVIDAQTIARLVRSVNPVDRAAGHVAVGSLRREATGLQGQDVHDASPLRTLSALQGLGVIDTLFSKN